MKKFFSLLWWIAITALTVSSCTFAFTQEQQEAYQWAYKYWLTTQPTIESARMNSPLTRQAFAKMVVNYLENVIWVKQTMSSSCYFLDESKITYDLVPYTKKTCAYQIMWSNWKNFNPTQPIDRAQLWTVFSRILWWDTYNVNGKWYYIYHLNALKNAGIMNNISNVVGSTAKRWDVMIMFKRTYEKFGSNVYLNGWDQSSNNYQPATQESVQPSNDRENSDNEYISDVYSNSNVIYTWKDWTRYYYDDRFLSMLEGIAEKQWESDLADYLKIEAEYYKNGLNQLDDLDDEELLKSMWIDTNNLDPDKMTKQEKQELVKKFKSGLGKIIDDNKDRNDKMIKDLGKITKSIKNDKFWLKEKYEKTKTFIESSNSFLDLYSESILGLIEIALTKEEGDESDEWMAQAFWLIWVALAYQWVAQEYQTYIEEWAVDTLKIFWLKSNNSDGNNIKQNNVINVIANTNNDVKTIVEDMIKNTPIRWDKNARFTIVEYTELLCPYCQRHSSEGTINTVMEQFPGEVNSLSKHFIIHWDDALKLASAMECIAELKPSIYNEAFEKAFEAYPVDIDWIINIATKLGVNKTSLQSCINEWRHEQAVMNMMNQGSEIFWVAGTPWNVVIDRKTGNFKLVSGAYPVDEFVKVINELKKMN